MRPVCAMPRPACAVPRPAAAACDNSGVCLAVMLPVSLDMLPGVEKAVSFLIKLFEFNSKL